MQIVGNTSYTDTNYWLSIRVPTGMIPVNQALQLRKFVLQCAPSAYFELLSWLLLFLKAVHCSTSYRDCTQEKTREIVRGHSRQRSTDSYCRGTAPLSYKHFRPLQLPKPLLRTVVLCSFNLLKVTYYGTSDSAVRSILIP
jgi:hypothetical protein